MLEQNTYLSTLVEMLDAKTMIYIWKNENELLFQGKVYRLYDMNKLDNKDMEDYYISYLRLNALQGVTVMITDKRQ